ncbi:hypothetical protein ODV97_18270 [Enterococcus gallinarum]|nr:hypothetical protein [Enterococcus gallinarum]
MLERIDSKEVDYIILLLCETQINENTDVIAFKTGDIYKQLIKQKNIFMNTLVKIFLSKHFQEVPRIWNQKIEFITKMTI